MKSVKKILALTLSICMIIGAVPMLASAETEAAEPAFTYTQDFDSITSVSELADDFHTRFSATSSVSNVTTFVEPTDLQNYMVLSNGTDGKYLERIRNTAVETDGNTCRPQWYQMYMFYKHRTFTEFEASVDLVNIHPSAFNMMHFGTNVAGDPYRQGFTVAVRATHGSTTNSVTVFLGNSSEVKSVLGTNWMISANGTSSVVVEQDYTKGINVKVAFKDGTATVYINGKSALTRTFDVAEYYIALAGANCGRYDNFTITSNDVAEDWYRAENGGYYENDFNANGNYYGIMDDFYLSHTPTNSSGSAAVALDVDEGVEYFTVINGTLERLNSDTYDGETYGNGPRAYYNQLYMYYKNQTFKEFELEVDMKLYSNPGCFQMIHFGGALTGNIYSQGFSVVAREVPGDTTKCAFFLGTASEAEKDLDNWFVEQDSGTSSYAAVTVDWNQFMHIKIAFKDGTAELYVNNSETPVATKSGLTVTEYYVALCEGWNSGIFDNLKITSTEPALERTEKDGSYSNNFNLLMKNELAEDFGFFYDKYTSADNSSDTSNDMIAVTEGTTYYDSLFAVSDNITRTFATGIDVDAGNNGNKPARSMMYYTYKNQKFTDFTLTVDAYYPGNSTCFDLITVGDYGQGIYNNNGYTVGFRHTGASTTDVFVGTAEQAKSNYCSWGPNTGYENYTSYTNPAGDKNLAIKIVVADGMLSLYINDDPIFAGDTAVEVGVVNGYISLANGIDKNATYDNLSIVGEAKLSYNGSVGVYAALDTSDNSDITELGYEINFADQWAACSTSDVADAVAGSLDFFATATEVVYADVNGDGSADVKDIVAIRANLLNGAEVNDYADMNEDGEVNIVDLVKIKKTAASAVETIKATEGKYTYAISFDGITEGYTGEATLTPYYVLNGATIYGEPTTVTITDGAIA